MAQTFDHLIIRLLNHTTIYYGTNIGYKSK